MVVDPKNNPHGWPKNKNIGSHASGSKRKNLMQNKLIILQQKQNTKRKYQSGFRLFKVSIFIK